MQLLYHSKALSTVMQARLGWYMHVIRRHRGDRQETLEQGSKLRPINDRQEIVFDRRRSNVAVHLDRNIFPALSERHAYSTCTREKTNKNNMKHIQKHAKNSCLVDTSRTTGRNCQCYEVLTSLQHYNSLQSEPLTTNVLSSIFYF
jgi:hypothetical protein